MDQNNILINPEPKRNPVKRVLSWITLYVEGVAFYYILSLFLHLVFILNGFASSLGNVAYAILLICFATTAFGIYIWGTISLSALSIMLSNKVCITKKGTRYIVVGIIGIISYAINILCMITGYITTEQPVFFYLLFADMIVYYIAIIVMRKTDELS